MPLDVTASVKLAVTMQEILTTGIESSNLAGVLSVATALAAGTGAGNIQQKWTKSATVTAAPVTWTLSAITDDLGRTIPFAKVRFFAIVNLGTADLLVGNAGSHPWAAPFSAGTERVRVPAGGWLAMSAPSAAGLAVGSGTSDQLKIDPAAATIDYQLVFLGE